MTIGIDKLDDLQGLMQGLLGVAAAIRDKLTAKPLEAQKLHSIAVTLRSIDDSLCRIAESTAIMSRPPSPLNNR